MRTIYRQCGKRTLDLIVAPVVLFVLSPLLLLIAIVIKLTSKGPVFYTQERIGKNGRAFIFVKFRTMVIEAEKKGAGILCLKHDPRVTLFGKLLRSFSLDELPQLLNVLKGEMSLVGPRPGLKFQVLQYTRSQRRRLEVQPGMTGWAQVNGRNSISWDERIRYDVHYVEHLSLLMDVRILLKTFKTVLFRENLIAAKAYFKDTTVGADSRETNG